MRDVHRALEALSEHEREVIELTYWSGLSASEVAQRLELPVEAVQARTRLVLGRLADLLD
jgi:RNA polymerase sigma-70 factor (ECF subfamily)